MPSTRRAGLAGRPRTPPENVVQRLAVREPLAELGRHGLQLGVRLLLHRRLELADALDGGRMPLMTGVLGSKIFLATS